MADRKDFESIALPHLDVVFRAAVALCGRKEQAEDLAQTTFMKALRRFDSLRPGSDCRSWLLSILRNTWIDELRHRKVVGAELPIQEGAVAQPQPTAETNWTDAWDLLENFGDEKIIQALGALSPEQRLTLYLVDVEQLSQADAAEVLGVAVGTVKSRASRAAAKLAGLLADHAKDLGLIGGER